MEQPTPPILDHSPGLAHPAANAAGSPVLGEPAALAAGCGILALCDEHLAREETLLADTLLSLRQVRDAFFQRNLKILPTLQIQQKQLAREAVAMAAARDHLRAALADSLGVSMPEATLRAAARTLPPAERCRLLQRRDRLAAMLREIEQLSHHNAALLSYARGFFACLFSVGRISDSSSLRYGRQGEPHDGSYGPLLEARV